MQKLHPRGPIKAHEELTTEPERGVIVLVLVCPECRHVTSDCSVVAILGPGLCEAAAFNLQPLSTLSAAGKGQKANDFGSHGGREPVP